MSFPTSSTVLRCSLLALALLGTAVQSTAALAVTNPLGHVIGDSYVEREININHATNWVNVQKNERVRIINTETGKSFAYQFDTLDHPIIELSRILPGISNNKMARVYVGAAFEEMN